MYMYNACTMAHNLPEVERTSHSKQSKMTNPHRRVRVRRRPSGPAPENTRMSKKSLLFFASSLLSVQDVTVAAFVACPSSSARQPLHQLSHFQSESRRRTSSQFSIPSRVHSLSNSEENGDDQPQENPHDESKSIPDLLSKPYASSLVREIDEDALQNVLASLERENYLEECETDPEKCRELEEPHNTSFPPNKSTNKSKGSDDPFWEQIKLEAENMLASEPQSGPQLYSLILSQPSLIEAVATIISNEIETELIPATSLRNLFLEQLTAKDRRSIKLDIMAAALRSPSVGTAINAILFNRGLHALVCYRVGHRLWQAGRTGLAYYMQSTVSSRFSADIHPACTMGSGIYLNCGGGVVIGETAVIGDDVSILQGVTLGGTGKEAGDRHPKVGDGVILSDGATVLGNIEVGDGAVVTAKSIVTKPVPPLARVAGVPAKVVGYREIDESHLFPDENALARPVALS